MACGREDAVVPIAKKCGMRQCLSQETRYPVGPSWKDAVRGSAVGSALALAFFCLRRRHMQERSLPTALAISAGFIFLSTFYKGQGSFRRATQMSKHPT